MCFVFPAAVPVGPEVSAALLPTGYFFAADSSQNPISQGASIPTEAPLGLKCREKYVLSLYSQVISMMAETKTLTGVENKKF